MAQVPTTPPDDAGPRSQFPSHISGTHEYATSYDEIKNQAVERALTTGRVLYVKNRSLERMTLLCRSKDCNYALRARTQKDGSIKRTSFQEHTCPENSGSTLEETISGKTYGYKPGKGNAPRKCIPISVLAGKVNASPSKKRPAQIRQILRAVKVEPTKSQVHAITQAFNGVSGIGRPQEDMLAPLMAQILEDDPEATVSYELGDHGGISRCFVAPSLTRRVAANSIPVIMVDGCHWKEDSRVILYLAVTVDPGTKTQLLAYGVGGNESDEEWSFFFDGLTNHLFSDEQSRPIEEVTVITDQGPGLLRTMRTHPTMRRSNHVLCAQHLKETIAKQVRGAASPFWELANTLDEQVFNDRLEQFIANFPRAAGIAGVSDQRIAQWSLRHSRLPRYGHATTNCVESLNNHILDVRYESLYQVCLRFWTHCLKANSAALREYHNLLTLEDPLMTDALVHKKSYGRYNDFAEGTALSQVPDGVVEVGYGREEYQVRGAHRDKLYVVRLRDLTCSCGWWQEQGHPCKHALAVIIKRGGNPKSAGLLHDFLSLERLAAAHSGEPRALKTAHLIAQPLQGPMQDRGGRGVGRPPTVRRAVGGFQANVERALRRIARRDATLAHRRGRNRVRPRYLRDYDE